jgi:hypothetical protein
MKPTASGHAKPTIPEALPPGVPDLEIALSKARAASVLLKSDADYLDIPVRLERDTEEVIRGWIRGFAFDALDAALEEAEAARRAVQGPLIWGPKRKAVA